MCFATDANACTGSTIMMSVLLVCLLVDEEEDV